jgi:hypothetical protein
VAALPVKDVEETIRPFFIRYVERKLIWEYANRQRALPKCNRK